MFTPEVAAFLRHGEQGRIVPWVNESLLDLVKACTSAKKKMNDDDTLITVERRLIAT